MEEQPFDPVQAEQREIDLAIERGFHFTLETKGFFGRLKKQNFHVNPPTLRTMVRLNRIFLELKFSEEDMKRDWMNVTKDVVIDNAKLLAEVVAIAVLNGRKVTVEEEMKLTNYFFENLTSQKLGQIMKLIYITTNISDFITSIRSLYVHPRITAPTLVEENQETEDQQD